MTLKINNIQYRHYMITVMPEDWLFYENYLNRMMIILQYLLDQVHLIINYLDRQ